MAPDANDRDCPDSQSAIAIIPARYASRRFPGKVLADRTGRPLIGHVFEAASRAKRVERVVIACDDDRVARAARALGAESVLTRTDHPNGTSRLAEAAALLALPESSIVANVQGDEPELDPGLIDAAVDILVASGADVGTVASPMDAQEDPGDPSLVKVVLKPDGDALYFSRSAIPSGAHPDGAGGAPFLRHVGLYAYRVRFLARYVLMEPTPLEQTERLEQLRVLEHGGRIAVAIRHADHHGIDTPEQYEAFVRRFTSRP